MREIPSKLHVRNIPKFRKVYLRRVVCYMRRAIYEHVLSSSENDYFTIEDFRNKHRLTLAEVSDIVAQMIEELEELGWNCKTSYNDTALFIYSTEDPPPLCFPDGF